MDFNIPPIGGGVERTGSAARNAPTPKADFSDALDAAVNVSTLPASPPPSVLEDMHVAARVAEELHAQARELHFETAGNGRVIVQVRDLDGNVIRTIPPARALEVASGAPLEAA
jgi:flagellar protein FlaG